MKTFDTTPDPFMLRGMQNQSWTVSGALSELVDNSFGKGRGNADRVEIYYEPNKRVIEVFDNGRGMDAIGRLFKLGDTIGRTPGDIGEYGSGGTMALLWLATRVTIWTLRKGKLSTDTVSWTETIAARKFPQVSDQWVNATASNTPARLWDAKHGTLILIHLSTKRVLTLSNVQKALGQNYAPAIRDGKILVWQTGDRERLHLSDPLELPEDAEPFKVKVKAYGKTLWAKGRIGLVPDLPFMSSRISVGFGHRVITKTRDCYSSLDGKERYAGTGIAGYLDLQDGWQPYISTTKDGIDDQEIWRTLMQVVFEEIRPLLKQVEEEELYVEMQDYAFALEQAMNGKFKVEVSRGKKMPEINWGDDNDPPHKRKRSKNKGKGGHRGQSPARSRIIITLLDDHRMEQLLCRAVLSETTIELLLNKDHTVVQETYKGKPKNKTAFNVLTTREVAHSMVDDRAALLRTFGKRVSGVIEDKRLNGGGHEQYVARLLVDGLQPWLS